MAGRKGGQVTAFPAPPHRGPAATGAPAQARCAVPAVEPERWRGRACAGV